MSKEAPARRNAAAATVTLTRRGTTPRSPRDRAPRGGRRLEGSRIGLNHSFCEAVQLLFSCQGSVIVTGMGKAGLIGQKIAATLASTGTRAHFLHPAEAFHGDLGRIHRDDVVLMLTQSGETAEVVQLLPSLREFGVPLVAITAAATSTRRPGGERRHRAGRIGRSLLAGPRAEHQHDGDAGGGRCAGAGAEQDAEFSGRRFRPVPSGRGAGPQAEPRGRHHAAARRMPHGPRRARRCAK